MAVPFIKYVGGKRRLAHQIVASFPKHFNKYVEPFCGSAAVYLYNWGQLESPSLLSNITLPPAVLSDANALLINCLQIVSADLAALIPLLKNAERCHQSAPEAYYNAQRERIPYLSLESPRDRLEAAVLYIYINRTAFNGIWRLNSKGEFNTPFNQSRKVNLVRPALKSAADILSHAKIFNQSYSQSITNNLAPGVLYFLDPPYVPVSVTSSFTQYTADGWNDYDSELLADMMNQIDDTGAYFLMTNSYTQKTLDIFARRNWKIDKIKAPRMIDAGGNREQVDEVVITNYGN